MWNLLADVGGTNMRLAALSPAGSMEAQQSYHSKGDMSFADAVAAFVTEQGRAPDHVVVAAAGIVTDRSVTLTNSSQSFSEADIVQVSGAADVHILNDFEAAAWSLATVASADVTPLQGSTSLTKGPRLIIGPGTGLGVGALVWAKGQPHVVPGEGGHISLAPHTAQERPYFEALVHLWPEAQIGTGLAVEAEAILSGTGIPRFCTAIAQANGARQGYDSSEQVFAAAQAGTDENAMIAVTLFRRYLGTLAGDLGLVFGATGGVFVTGGVAHANPWLFDDRFIDAFNAGGRHSGWRQAMPVYLYQNPNFGLEGARNFLAGAMT